MLTDEQNQELEKMIADGRISRNDEEVYAQKIKERDRDLFRKNDQDKADEEGLSLDAYHKKYGIEAEPEPPKGTPLQPQETASGAAPRTEPTYNQLKTMYPEQYNSLQRKYANDPDADAKIEATLKRGHKEGGATPVTPEPPTPVNNAREPTYEELKIMYPDNYNRIYQSQLRNGQVDNASIEESLRIVYQDTPKPLPETTTPTQPTQPAQPAQPERELTYEELQLMYPDKYQSYTNMYANGNKYTNTPASPEQQAMMIEGLLRAEHTDRTQAGTAPPLPAQTTTPAPETTTPSGGGPVDYRPRNQQPMQNNESENP